MELVIVLAIVGVLASLGITRYLNFIYRARVVRAVADIRNIAANVEAYDAEWGVPPDTLIDVDTDWMLDPWQKPYRYLPLVDENGFKNFAQSRKDRFLVPLNTRFDLYSEGLDGLTAAELSVVTSRDDVVRANDGGYIGLGSRY